MPSRSSPRSCRELKKCPPSLKLRRDSLRSRPRRERRLGGKGIRTPGLLIANETLYQLSYTPVLPMKTGLNKSGKKFPLSTPFAHRYITIRTEYSTNPACYTRLANLFTAIHQTESIMPGLRSTARRSSAPYERQTRPSRGVTWLH